MARAVALVKFIDYLEELDDNEREINFGILDADDEITCLCCGGVFNDPEDYQILERIELGKLDAGIRKLHKEGFFSVS